jgi:biopolymer transport protein TolR
MVTAPLLTTGLKIDLPDVQASNTPIKDARLLVTVTKDERVLFGEDDVTSTILQSLLTNTRVQNEKELYIRADKDARYGIVAEVVAAARASGVVSLNLLVEPKADLEPPPPNPGKADGSKGGKDQSGKAAPGAGAVPGNAVPVNPKSP